MTQGKMPWLRLGKDLREQEYKIIRILAENINLIGYC